MTLRANTGEKWRMIGNILIGLDGSPYSETAVELGIQWARRTAAVLTGLAIIDEPTIRRAEPVPIGGSYYKTQRDQACLQDARHRVDSFLEQFAKQCESAGVNHKELREVGLPSKQILAEAEDFDLTLLGQRTYFHFETQTSADETLDAVLHHSHRPVAAIPRKLPASSSVVVAYDASPSATRALDAFQRSGLCKTQAIHVVSIDRDEALAARHAEEGARFLQFHGMPAVPRPLMARRRVGEMLLDEIKELNAGMVVMGAHGHHRFREFLRGSTTRTVVKQSETLLFLHH
jgi:nucleotide-binding universal stress UspA family protein